MRKNTKILLIALAFMVSIQCCVNAEIMLEPFTYCEDFETRELSAWVSYPLWQDTAYDPNFLVNDNTVHFSQLNV